MGFTWNYFSTKLRSPDRRAVFCMLRMENLALLTDLYQLTMAQSYFQSQRLETATFSLFIRSYPANRSYFVAAGLKDVLEFLERFAVDAAGIDYLHSRRIFNDAFLDFLKDLRFTGEVWAIPEGRLFFKDEPVLEVTAPVIQAQIVETFIINQIHFQSLIATKAARCVHAARGRAVVDFSLRRTHGIDAGMKVARSSYLAGFSGTSNVQAGQHYGIPIVGTMAHSFVSSFENEIDAFRAFVNSFPNNSILLIDTYDTIAGAHKAVEIAREMNRRGQRLQGVRIDSGDLAKLAASVRQIFDQAGFNDIKIVGSGGLDEYDLAEYAAGNVPYDSYGVGTRMGTSGDAPWTDIAYKLVEYDGRPVLKLSTGKVSIPGKKQVFRLYDGGQRLRNDVIALRDEKVAGAEPLLEQVMVNGRSTTPPASLEAARSTFLAEFKRLPEALKAIQEPALYPVELTNKLQQLSKKIEGEISQSR
jgi:nicotinate phosphoribosyltransferase